MSSKQQAKPEPDSEEVVDIVDAEPQEEGHGDLVRAVADYQNALKRFDAERKDIVRFSQKDFIESLLPVVDNFYRATEHIPAELKDSPWVSGILYIQKNLIDVLEKQGVAEIPAKVGDHFDPHVHEAIGVVHEQDQPDDVITEVKNQGYKLYDRVLRPVQVIVNHHSTN